jgi:hypothetical protein
LNRLEKTWERVSEEMKTLGREALKSHTWFLGAVFALFLLGMCVGESYKTFFSILSAIVIILLLVRIRITNAAYKA